MTFGGPTFAESTLAGTALIPLIVVEEPDPINPVIHPLSMEIGGVPYTAMDNSLSVTMEMGSQWSASFELVNPPVFPLIGQPVKIMLYTAILFVGAIDRVTVRSEPSHSVTIVSCECTDNSYLLFRKKVKRTFSNSSIATIALAMMADELSGDNVSLGYVGSFPVIPLVEADNVTIYDLLREATASVGGIFSIDHNKRLLFQSAIVDLAPMTIDEDMAEECSITLDRETYRNKQMVIVTGTPQAQNEQPLTVTYTSYNNEQISQQATIEGTSGIYNDILSITHPTSNNTINLTKLAVAYAKTSLGITGAMRETLTVRTIQYGFRPGQMATVDLPHLGLSGSYVVQKVSLRDVDGRWLSTTMDLSPSTLRKRSSEIWLDIVKAAKVTVLPPTAITTQTQTYNTPGTYSFVVPNGTTVVQVSCFGAGGGGGGGAYHQISVLLIGQTKYAGGAPGGRGGMAISVIDAVPGETLTITVPSGGSGGITDRNIDIPDQANGTNGGTGGTARVQRAGNATICEAYGGIGGTGGQANALTGLAATFVQSPSGSGLGLVVTTGGGMANGGGGDGVSGANGQAGQNGRVIVEY